MDGPTLPPLKTGKESNLDPPLENYDVIGPHVNQDRGLQRGLHNWEDVLRESGKEREREPERKRDK